MNGKVICVIGDTGSGKSTFVKGYCKPELEILVYLRISTDFVMKGAKIFTNFLEFLKEANKKTNAILIIDEAFTALGKNVSAKPDKPNHFHNKILDLLVNARKLNNFVFIIFHALTQIPSNWLLAYLDYLVRYRTNDTMQYQISRFSSFPNIAENLRKFTTLLKHKRHILKLR